MDTEQFVDAIKHHVRDAAIEDTINKLISPPGRRVSAGRRTRSDWYNSLSEEDAQHVRQIAASVADEVIFGLFAVFDGSRVVAEGRFELLYVNEKRVLLNDPAKIGLNEIFNAAEETRKGD